MNTRDMRSLTGQMALAMGLVIAISSGVWWLSIQYDADFCDQRRQSLTWHKRAILAAMASHYLAGYHEFLKPSKAVLLNAEWRALTSLSVIMGK